MQRHFLLILLLSLGLCACKADRYQGVEVFDPDDEEVASGPEVKKSRFQVYWLFEPQVNRVNTQGVFTIAQDKYDARLVSSFWEKEFLKLTGNGYYAPFFDLYYEYAHGLAQGYPIGSPRVEEMLEKLEKRFLFFCSNKGVEAEFLEYQAKMEAILLN